MSAQSLHGIGVGSRAITGPVWVLQGVGQDLPSLKSDRGVDHEVDVLQKAIAKTAHRVRADASAADSLSSDILEALLAIIEDPEVIELARPSLEEGFDAATALQSALDEFAEMMGDDEDFQSRVGDLKAIGREVGRECRGEVSTLQLPTEGEWILVASDLTPMETSKFGPSIVGVITERGGPTSHTAIICRARNIPAVVSCHGALGLAQGDSVLLDPEGNRVVPGGDISDQTQSLRLVPQGDEPLITVRANVGSLAEAEVAATTLARGVGLFRTEVLYLNAHQEPTLDEQQRLYREVFLAAPAGKIVVRTIDAGSDKPVPFLTLPHEENPALGVRGFRMAERYLDFQKHQLEAIAAATRDTGRDVAVMAPMVSTREEVVHFRDLCQEVGIQQVGIMVETPAIISVLPDLSGLLSFVSIGTNDLSQYLFAADRLHPDLGTLNSPWQPGLLREVHRIAQSAQALGIPVGVCGESAANPMLSIVFAGMGIDSVSAAPSAVNDVVDALRAVSETDAKRCADVAVSSISARDAESSVRTILEEL